jgi:hypothetical protein
LGSSGGKLERDEFSWTYAEKRRGNYLVDGASRAAVDWYLKIVYQPHYDHFQADFSKTIQGFFYDEPETLGDWGTEVIPMLKSRGVDWKKALVSTIISREYGSPAGNRPTAASPASQAGKKADRPCFCGQLSPDQFRGELPGERPLPAG